jgi:murein endopeptidase
MLRALLLSFLFAAPAWAESADAGVVQADADAGLVIAEALPAQPTAEAPTETDSESDEGDEGEESEGDIPSDPVLEAALADAGILYTSDLGDEALARLWVEAPETLGSISVGVNEAGRIINGVQLPEGEAWRAVDPNNAWGTQETIDFLTAAATAVREEFGDAPALRVNHISKKSGGYLRPHQSHQAGRDVDLGFYYPLGEDPGRLSKKRELAMDLPMNWALVKALLVHGDVEFILVDKRIQKRLYDYALSIGEDKEWLARLFHAGNKSMVRHARRHRDHFHVRYFSARSQELGRRIGPLLARQPEQNLVIHRVRKGDTLGAIALKYNSGVKLIQKANGLSSTNLKVGRTLNVPLRGPCTSCPVPPPLVVPPRCLPPQVLTKS